jgi:hypothetical protein
MPSDREASPFTGIAPPEPGAVEQWRQRQEQTRRRRRQLLGGFAAAVAGSALASSIGICLQEGVRPFPAVFVAGLAGAVAGLLAGVLIGCACFALMALSGTRHGPSYESKLATRDPMSVTTVLVVAWGLIGVLAGSAWGGLQGASWFLNGETAGADMPAAFTGAIVGVVLTGIGWLFLGRRGRPGAPVRDDKQGTEA